jgi:predicted nucleic acid-binding protein
MTSVFADSFFYLALLNPRDAAHSRVREVEAEFRGSIVTTHWVLVEVADALSRPQDRSKFRHLLSALANDSRVTIVAAEGRLFDLGVLLYNSRSDKYWSLTDCLSFIVMKQQSLTEAFTADSHFGQAGFVALFGNHEA